MRQKKKILVQVMNWSEDKRQSKSEQLIFTVKGDN